MPEPAKRYCAEPGCKTLIRGAARCDTHKRSNKRSYVTRVSDKFYRTAKWTKDQRPTQLAKEPFCVQIVADGKPCGRVANVVDHIIPRQLGGPDVPSNYQSLCKKCHDKKTAKESSIASSNHCEVTLVCGPPGSGKTKYVRDNRAASDMVVDIDAIGKALMLGHSKQHQASDVDVIIPFAIAARDAIIDRLTRPHSLRRVWIIDSGARRQMRNVIRERLHAKVLVLEVPAKICKERCTADDTRMMSVDWSQLIDKWWSEYESDLSDVRVNR